MSPAIDRRRASRSPIATGALGVARDSKGSSTGGGGVALPDFQRRPGGARPLARAGRALFALCAGATLLIGCPLYADECDSRNDCASGFYCDPFSRQCEPVLDAIGCSRPNECEVGETCTPDFVCRPGSCDYHGCVRGYRCGVVDFAHTCVRTLDEAGPEDASLPAAPDAGPVDAGLDLDAGSERDAGVDAADAGP